MMKKMKKEDIFYQAMLARDPRFDGKFFVGVKTTGIYCRPICPAKPKRENVEFFASSLEAEKGGYRPCLRCRPESAPQSAAWVGKSAVVQRAVKVLHTRDVLDFDEDQFAALFGVSARHLRRLFMEEIGKTPKQLSFENRLNLSRKLITETALSMTEIAFAAGFSSIRRFNDAFKERFKKSPREVRRQKISANDTMKISLAYRPPFDFAGLMASYESHRIGDLEWFEEGKMHRVVSMDGKVGQIAISDVPENSRLLVEMHLPDTAMIYPVISRVRSLFDLDSDPVLVANSLEMSPEIKKLLKKFPGIRLPSGWDAFEVATATILGQLVSVDRARALVHDLIEIAGQETSLEVKGKNIKLFPTPKQLAEANLQNLKTTGARKQALKEFAKAVHEKRISLESTQDVESFIQSALKIRGIGSWTAHYMALKVLRSTDIFPATDLILARAVEKHSPQAFEKMSPWRGYAAALLWRASAEEKKQARSR